MRGNERAEAERYAGSLLTRMKDSTFPKDYLVNHGVDFTGGPEQLSRERFGTYISSCGYLLMEDRIKKEEAAYHGE